MTAIYLILLVLAAGCFLASALGRRTESRVDLFPLGLFFWVLVPLLQTLQSLTD